MYILPLSNVKRVEERESVCVKINVLKTVSLGWWTKAPLRKIQLLSGAIIYIPTFYLKKKKKKRFNSPYFYRERLVSDAFDGFLLECILSGFLVRKCNHSLMLKTIDSEVLSHSKMRIPQIIKGLYNTISFKSCISCR